MLPAVPDVAMTDPSPITLNDESIGPIKNSTSNHPSFTMLTSSQARRVDKIVSWLAGSSAPRDVQEHILSQKHRGSGDWFLDSTDYCRWKNMSPNGSHTAGVESLNTNWHERVLFVHGPPGFGKTFLSTRVIEDLGHERTAFFFFSTARSSTDPDDAFRAVTTQLVHSYRHDRATLDSVSHLLRRTSNQERASRDDVLSVLYLLLRYHPAFLVFDGVDECSDVQGLLNTLSELCRKLLSGARVILFSRPDIRIPIQYQKWTCGSPQVLSLAENQNIADVENFLMHELDAMAARGSLGEGNSLDPSHVAQLASHSSGSFLWAGLFVKYLKSFKRSPAERQVSLQEDHHLLGVPALYRLILMTLDREDDQDRNVVAELFRWLAFSLHSPLCSRKLGVVLAIASGQSKNRSASEFADWLNEISCGLVEVIGGTMHFTHRSAQEYLQSTDCQQFYFSLHDDSLVHGHLAATCLSYLTNEVPRRPLQDFQPPRLIATPSSGSTSTGSSSDSGYRSVSSTSDATGMPTGAQPPQGSPPFDTDLPFLRYATLCWPIHFTRSLSSLISQPQSTKLSSIKTVSGFPGLLALSRFLAQHSAVTVWVEASWMYSLPPTLSRLIPLLSKVKSRVFDASSDGRELDCVIHSLRQFNEALLHLRENHGATLAVYPGLVWQMANRQNEAAVVA